MSLRLKKHLFDAYEGFADKRVKDLTKRDTFIVDDRGGGDFDAHGELFLWFCKMFAVVRSDRALDLILSGDPPLSPEVEEFVKGAGRSVEKSGVVSKSITLALSVSDGAKLRDLAARMRRITRPGARYSVPSYKYVVPRTADSLERLADVLDAYCKTQHK
jgi:hypothetical protein